MSAYPGPVACCSGVFHVSPLSKGLNYDIKRSKIILLTLPARNNIIKYVERIVNKYEDIIII